jgi:organic hydroperoxide reductase OsmC/OhrA
VMSSDQDNQPVPGTSDLAKARRVSDQSTAETSSLRTRQHVYELTVTWRGNRGSGTSHYRAYARDHDITAPGKPAIPASSDPAFRGDPARWSPEELLVASLSACHQLWYLHLCADAGIVLTSYEDSPKGVMTEDAGSGTFTHVQLRPHVTIAVGADSAKAQTLHEKAHEMCFIARSVRFPVEVAPTVSISELR